MKRSIAAALLCGLLLTGCPPPVAKNGRAPVDRNAIAERIRRDEAGGVADWASRDVDRIATRYAANGSLIVPCQPRLAGAARIRAHVAALLRDPNFELRFDPDRVDVAESGDLAYSVGTYTARATNPATGRPHSEVGNYLTTYRRHRDGSWKAIDGAAVHGGPPQA